MILVGIIVGMALILIGIEWYCRKYIGEWEE